MADDFAGVQLGAFWINTSKNGNTYLGGSFGPYNSICIFKNTQKRPDKKDPDYIMYAFKKEKKKETETQGDFFDKSQDQGSSQFPSDASDASDEPMEKPPW